MCGSVTCVKTTLDIDDGLYREIKVMAARNGETITSVIELALREALLRRGPRPRPSLPVLRGTGGLRPGVDITDNAAVRELLDAPSDPA
jgi:hypothetical protein